MVDHVAHRARPNSLPGSARSRDWRGIGIGMAASLMVVGLYAIAIWALVVVIGALL
jgi:hypothetical protein